MCGICGYVSSNRIDDAILVAMNDTMIHRGPDDSGIWQHQSDKYAVGFAQRRLSILDLSELGHQPMLSDDGQLVITYNGEVYNFKELRSELESKGHTFKSDCDTEVILAAYSEWGTGCFSQFNGMFAIAIYDLAQDRLVLARDRMGKKPLYYYHKDGDFVFASELKPIMKYPGFEKKISFDGVSMFLCNKCIQAPYSIFEDTYKLEPGSYLLYNLKTLEITKDYYWNLIDIANNSPIIIGNLDTAKKKLKELLYDSIEKRLISDVPVGTFLSAGIDSSLVTAMANEVKKGKIDSFTIGFDDKERDEAPVASRIAQYLGTNHHEKYISEADIFSMMESLPDYYDEPFSDSSQLPSMLVSKMAVNDVTVALSGDGGDELFCGYKMYDLCRIVQRIDWIGKFQKSLPWNDVLSSYFPGNLKALIDNREWKYKSQLFADANVLEVNKLLCTTSSSIKSAKEERILTHNLQYRRMLLDMVNYMPDDILHKMDRASMKYSLEVRCPIIDYRIVEWSFGLDHSLKYHHGEKKYLLKQVAYDLIPEELLNQPKKGFGVPLRKWLRTTLKDEIARYSEERVIRQQGIFDYEALQRLIQKQSKSDYIIYSSLLWSFYVFQLWYNRYVEPIGFEYRKSTL